MRNLTLAHLNLADLNDKLGLLSGITQGLNDDGTLPIAEVVGIAFYSPLLTPALVGGNAESTQAFTLNGIRPGDVIVANKPSKQAGLSLFDVFCVTANTLSLTFRNFTGGGITPTSEKYRIIAFRSS